MVRKKSGLTIAKRIQYEITAPQLKAFQILMEETGTRTKRDLITNAISFLRWIAVNVKGGRKIISMSKKGDIVKEIILPF